MGIDHYAHTIVGCRYEASFLLTLAKPVKIRNCSCKDIDTDMTYCGKCGKLVWNTGPDQDIEEICRALAETYDLEYVISRANGYPPNEGIAYFGKGNTNLLEEGDSCTPLPTPASFAKIAIEAWDNIIRMEQEENFNGQSQISTESGIFGMWTILEVSC